MPLDGSLNADLYTPKLPKHDLFIRVIIDLPMHVPIVPHLKSKYYSRIVPETELHFVCAEPSP
jgi:hypothetical protein